MKDFSLWGNAPWIFGMLLLISSAILLFLSYRKSNQRPAPAKSKVKTWSSESRRELVGATGDCEPDNRYQICDDDGEPANELNFESLESEACNESGNE